MTEGRSGSPTAGPAGLPGGDEADAPASSGYGRRVSGFAVDQVISGGSNVLLVVVAARLLDVDGFARVSIVFLVYGLVVVTSRSIIAIPVLMHPREVAPRTGDVVQSAWAVGLAAGLVVLVGALATLPFDRPLALALALMGVLAPALVLQDVGRFLAFTTRRIPRAIVLDVVWLASAAAAITAVHVTGSTTAAWFVAAWAGSGAVSALLVHVFWPAAPRPGLSWLRTTRAASVLTFVETVVLQVGALALVAVSGIFAGRQFIAGFAGAQLLSRPISLVLQAMSASGVSEIAHGEDRRGVVRATWLTSLLATTGCVAVLGVLLALPDSLGELVLGENWYPTEALLLPFAAYMTAEALSCGPHAALRGLHRLRLLVSISVVWTVLAVVACAIGYGIGGPSGIIWGVAAARGAYVAVLVVYLARHLDGWSPTPDETSTTTGTQEPTT